MLLLFVCRGYYHGGATLQLSTKFGITSKYKSRRTDIEIEHLVIAERLKGLNRYEIHSILRPRLLDKTPSPVCIYQISKRYNLNRLKAPMKEEKRKIIKEEA